MTPIRAATCLVIGLGLGGWLLWPQGSTGQQTGELESLAAGYTSQVRPLLQRYCFECHAGDTTEAEIDFAPLTTLADVRRHTATWIKVREMLDSGQMPPKDEPQPTDDERTRLQTWVRDYLTLEARAQAGDPGQVVLRRLSNDEYTYTLRDLTGLESLEPAREFPVDGAAGEGFTNAGSGLVMSPSLLRKYLDAARGVAQHAVLTPSGIRFSPATTRRDFTDELLAEIQAFYREFTEDGGGSAVNLQGIKFDTNQGGRLPLERYLSAALATRDALEAGQTSLEKVAAERRLNAKYLTRLWQELAPPTEQAPAASLLLGAVRERWRTASAAELPALVADISRWQDALWKFNSIGQYGREGGPQRWMEPVAPLTARHEFRLKLPATPTEGDFALRLAASDLGDGRAEDFVVWERPRIEFPDRPPILLRDVPALMQTLRVATSRELARTVEYLAAVAELRTATQSVAELAAARRLEPTLLEAWVRYVDVGSLATPQITGHLSSKIVKGQGYEAINGWGIDGLPNVLANSSDQPISFLTLTVPARGVTVHPSPEQESIVAWRSPIAGSVKVQGLVADADDKCGNGAAWRVERWSTAGSTLLAEGVFDNGGRREFAVPDPLELRPGEVIRLVINARERNHACDTTHVNLVIREVDGQQRSWDLAVELVDRILHGNPLPDAYGHADTWHFCASGNAPPARPAIPPQSSLARWRDAIIDGLPADEITRQARAVQEVLTSSDTAERAAPDQEVRRLLTDWHGPLGWLQVASSVAAESGADTTAEYGLPVAEFGVHPSGAAIAPENVCRQAPHVLDLRLPARLVGGGEFVVTGTLHAETGRDGSVQLDVALGAPSATGTLAGPARIVVLDGSPARERVERSLEDFRQLFPPALCYARIVPVDEVVTLTLYYREDDQLQRLMLNDDQLARLERLWDELFYVSREPLALVVAFEQISEFATQDRPDLVEAFKPLKQPIQERAEAFRQRLSETEPVHLEAVLRFAERAWRRPLSPAEEQSLRDLYRQLRGSDLSHEEAIQLTLARVLTSPLFLYRQEQPVPGDRPGAITDHELAVRLSYFLWSSLPDQSLRDLAADGTLSDDKIVSQQAGRMLADPRTRRLAIQFACQWLHLRDFDQVEEKNEQLFPEFVDLRGAMYEETVLFFEDMFRRDGSVLGLLDADHTFLNEELARHYGIAGVTGPEWRRVEGIQSHGRGGVLGLATVLASQSGASRTSPILRGNWVSETLLGERLPRPPANVPQLPDTVPSGLNERQLIELHSSVAACAKCHAKIDPYGFALEQYDVLGRRRPAAMDTKTQLVDGTQLEGLEGLRDYLVNTRRDAVLRQFCRKLLGYALGREVQLSDELLLTEMQRQLETNDYRFSAAVETIIQSPQFRTIRPLAGSPDSTGE